ncbi:hypothetical protein CBL_03004 [Carabus blaptoides fortunei]
MAQCNGKLVSTAGDADVRHSIGQSENAGYSGSEENLNCVVYDKSSSSSQPEYASYLRKFNCTCIYTNRYLFMQYDLNLCKTTFR